MRQVVPTYALHQQQLAKAAFTFNISAMPPDSKRNLLDKAKEAPTLFRVAFEVTERRLSEEHPQLLLSQHWSGFVGIGMVAGCQLIAMFLHHETPLELRTEIELAMRESLELSCSESSALWEDACRHMGDRLIEIPRGERFEKMFQIQAEWIIRHITDDQQLDNQREIVSCLASLLRNEVPGYWSSAQDLD